MAVDTGHAAKQYDRTFSVELFSEDEPATVLVAALSDFLDAVDCATEWLEQEDPARTKTPSLGIFATAGGLREQVWAYPPKSVNRAEGEPKRLVELFGFDPVAWNPPSREANMVRGRPPERESASGGERLAFRGVGPPSEVDSRPAGVARVQLATRLRTANGRRLREELGAAWHDRLSRWCLIVGSVFLWLTITLVEPAFLVSFLAAATILWSRHTRRAGVSPDDVDDVDDWF